MTRRICGRFASSAPGFLLRRTVTLGLLLSPLVAGCSPGGGKSASGGKCFAPQEITPEPSTPLEAIEYPTSQVWLVAAIPEKNVTDGLSREIPFTLASEKKRDVGAPGYATYRVTRGTPEVQETKSGLEIKVPINADISVCKKIGSACLQYGSCKPSFEARFSLDTNIGKNYSLAPPEGTISATKRCVIGIDVTSQIEKIAKQEVAKVEAEIEKQWPELEPEVKRVWKQMRAPLALDDDQCLHIHPKKLFFQAPRFEEKDGSKTLVAALGLRGKILPAPDCTSERKGGKLPKPQAEDKPGSMSKLWFPEILSLESAEAELKNSLAGAWGDGGELKVKEAHIESGRVLLSLQASGAVCGSFWLEGKLTHRAGSGHLSLKDVKLSGAGETPSEMADLIVHVLDRAKISLVSKDWFDEERIMPLEAALRRTVPEKVKFEIQNLEAKDAKIVAATDGLYVLHPLTARLVITGF